ncbi:M56 family metallopeptidase [Aquimarina sp. M1]
MITYIIKSSLCLMLLWAFYKLFLEKENVHFIKRFYLLFSLVFAFIIPLITLTYQVEVIAGPKVISETTTPILIEPEAVIAKEPVAYLPIVLWSIYAIGMLVFGFRFIRNITNISKKIRNNERLKEPSHINVLLCNSIVPHTFLSYIFVPRKEFQDNNIPKEVLLHEKTHVVQKHTLDILFVEVLQVIFWFNPLFILMKRSIKLNHEFLADHNVLKQQFSIQNYFKLLVNYPDSSNQAVLSSPINYSLTKKRLQMMTKEFSKKRTVLKLTGLLPIVLLCILFFNNEIVAKEVVIPLDEITNQEENPTIRQKPSVTVLKDKEESNSLNESPNTLQDGVTKEMIEEYNTWAKDLGAKIKGNKPIRVRQSEIYRMINIYKNMTSDQRKGAEEFPDIPPPPPVPESQKVHKGEKNDIPPPPPPSKAPKVKKGQKSDIPPPPPPAPKEKKSKNEKSKKSKKIKTKDGYTLLSEKEDWTEEEKSYLKERVYNELERERAEIEREEARMEQEITAGNAMLSSEERREVAEKARVIAMETANRVRGDHRNREIARENARISREAAEKGRVIALEASQEARIRAEKAMKSAEIKARNAEKEMRSAEELARKEAIKSELQSRKAMRAAEMQHRKAEKEARKAEMEARKAEMNARKAEYRVRQMAEDHKPEKIIEHMAQKDADFYYNEKQISAREALKLVEDSNNTLSIDASTKNGKSKVIIKD